MNMNVRKENVLVTYKNSDIDFCPEINECIKSPIVPDNDFDFKILTNLTNTKTESGNISNTAKISHILVLSNDTVTFSNLSCVNSGHTNIILALPLTFTKKCNVYSLVLPDIDSKKKFKYNKYVIIKNNNGVSLPVDLQVANGYLYIIINITDAHMDTTFENKCKIKLSFTKFFFNLNKNIVCCSQNIICIQ